MSLPLENQPPETRKPFRVCPKKTLPPVDVTRATRGVFLPQHNVRVIEQDNLIILEFLHHKPWYTRKPSLWQRFTRLFRKRTV